MSVTQYEPVIGLEIHAELQTASKMFCACAIVDTLSAAPNTAVCPVCGGLPGSLPVLNQRAVDHALLVGLALGCRINSPTVFARKNYFYPDLPKGFQISQFDLPLAAEGQIQILVGDARLPVRIRRVHLEEDTAKLAHRVGEGNVHYGLVDFNRSGVPLLEIVTEPDLFSLDAVQAYATAIRALLRALGVNSGDMEKGILRFEANVSVRPIGTRTLGTRTEIKNLNSFRALVRATQREIERQSALLQAGGTVIQETVGWDEARGETYSQRSKEHSHDYRYFPEPDLPHVIVDDAWIADMRAQLPELPQAKADRFVAQYALPFGEATLLASDNALAHYFEAAVTAHPAAPRALALWIAGELFALLNENGGTIESTRVRPAQLAALQRLLDDGVINRATAKDLLIKMFATGEEPAALVEAGGLRQIADTDVLTAAIAKIITDNPQQLAQYLQGKDALFDWFFGQVMRATKGKAAPQVARQVLRDALEARRAG